MQIQTSTDRKELKSHGEFDFPVYVSYEVLSQYESGSFLWHWHPEIELTLVLKGSMYYQINDKVYHIREGDSLFGNSNTLHTGHMYDGQDCIYISTTFHPKAIYGYEPSLIQEKYMDCILKNPNLSSIHFTNEWGWHREITSLLKEIYQAGTAKPLAWEMKIQMMLTHIWILIFENSKTYETVEPEQSKKHMDRVKNILSFIQIHYTEKLTLERIAASVGLCRSECCRFFKKYMGQSLFDYLNSYRIAQSLSLLLDENYNITEIATRSGFSNPCYYTKLFRRLNGCSPSEYRRAKLSVH